MLISSRSTDRSINWSYPCRRSEISTIVPFWPRSRLTALSLVHPFVSCPLILAITSPRRMPLR